MSIRREIYCPQGSQSSCNCSPSSSERVTVNVRSDFKIRYVFRDNRYSPALIVPLSAFDVEIKYYVFGRPETYMVAKSGSNMINCVGDSEAGVLKAIFENTGLYPGQLMAEFKFKFPDPEFPDQYGSVVVPQDTGITLVD